MYNVPYSEWPFRWARSCKSKVVVQIGKRIFFHESYGWGRNVELSAVRNSGAVVWKFSLLQEGMEYDMTFHKKEASFLCTGEKMNIGLEEHIKESGEAFCAVSISYHNIS